MYKELKIVDATAVITTATSAVVPTSTSSRELGKDLVLHLDVTAASGTTPTMDITVKGMVNGKAYTLGTFTQATGVTGERIVIASAPVDVRLDWAIGGTTPSFTFNVIAHRAG